MSKKYLIVHLVSFGDCLMMTAVAKQIKVNDPTSHITWAISYKCKQVIENNPYVDQIWEITYGNNESPWGEAWERTKAEAEEKKEKGEFDEIIYSQIYPDNPHHYDGTTRSSTFRAYNGEVTNVTPVMQLTHEEVSNVTRFAQQHKLEQYQNVILCESSPGSGQSFITQALILELCRDLIDELDNTAFIISSNLPVQTDHQRIIDGSQLTYRENAELSKYCTLFMGCSSGISWLLTSNWAKKINNIQFLKMDNNPFRFASMAYDLKYWNVPIDHIIETDESEKSKMKALIVNAVRDFQAARNDNNKFLKPSIESLKININSIVSLRSVKTINRALYSTRIFFERNGLRNWRRFAFAYMTKLFFLRTLNLFKRNKAPQSI